MLFALVVMAGVLLLAMVVNNRSEPSWWGCFPLRKRRTAGDGSAWVFGGDFGADSGSDCGADGRGGGGGGGGGGV